MKMNTNLQIVLEVFFDNPTTPLHIRKIARIINLSPAAVSNYLKELESRELIKKYREEVTTEYKANKESEEFKWRKRINNIKSLYESGLITYLVNKYGAFTTIVLFGSYLQGEDWENSDIDIAVISPNKVKVEVTKFKHILKREISIHEPDLKKVSKEFLNNLANGLVLRGYIDYGEF